MAPGVLRVRNTQAFGLTETDKAGASDRYVRFTLEAGSGTTPVSVRTKRQPKVRYISERPDCFKYAITAWEEPLKDELLLEVPDGFMKGKLSVSLWQDGSKDDGCSLEGAMCSLVLDVGRDGALVEPIPVEGLKDVQVSFNYEVIFEEPPPPPPTPPPAKFINTPRGINVVRPNDKSLAMAVELARRVAGDSQKELTVMELLQRGANVLETPRNVPRLSSLSESERIRIADTNKKVLHVTLLSLQAVADDANEALTTLLCRQIFVRAIAARTKEGGVLQTMRSGENKLYGVHSMSATV